jgi:malonyl-CoA/methylmalonyl-CoA synthetase|tara:strand:- start:1911 stop:3377 length:1467 start_codon:yes stop_codon:yes gene_type:complete
MNAQDFEIELTETLPSLWANIWRKSPQRNVLYDEDSGWLTGGDLLRRSELAARKLSAAGIVPGDRVVLSGPSSTDFVICHVAILRLGCVVVPANGAYREKEIKHVIQDSRPAAAIVDNSAWEPWIKDINPAIIITTSKMSLPDGPAIPLDQVNSEQAAYIGYTSGTTGRPKGALLSHLNLLSSVRALELAWRWVKDDTLILALPLFHMHGLGVGLHGGLTVGCKIILQRDFDPGKVIEASEQFEASMFFGVPTMYGRLVESPRAHELKRLRLCVSGSAPLPADLHVKFEEITGQKVLERYGMTETVMLVSNPYDLERRPGSVGFPLPGVEVRLSKELSEIEVSGPNIFEGYWENPDANSEAFNDGWFKTGDIGQLDDDGYLSIVGRAKELIISGGYNVYPREVEDVLNQHPDVLECAVVGEMSGEWGETVVAYVVSDRQFEDEELKLFAGTYLADFKRPRFTYGVDALPRNALGKVQKHRLMDGRVAD